MGMAEAMGDNVYTFYTLDGALEFQRAVRGIVSRPDLLSLYQAR